MSHSSGTGSRKAQAYDSPGPVLLPEQFAVITASGNITLTNQYRNRLKIDPGGSARDVTLPAAEAGLWFEIVNAADASENIVVKNPAASTIVTINQNERAIVFCSDEDTPAWTLYHVATIALS